MQTLALGDPMMTPAATAPVELEKLSVDVSGVVPHGRTESQPVSDGFTAVMLRTAAFALLGMTEERSTSISWLRDTALLERVSRTRRGVRGVNPLPVGAHPNESTIRWVSTLLLAHNLLRAGFTPMTERFEVVSPRAKLRFDVPGVSAPHGHKVT